MQARQDRPGGRIRGAGDKPVTPHISGNTGPGGLSPFARGLNIPMLMGGMLSVLVLGYWGFGKSFAYLGLHPVYIGETLMAATLLLALQYGRIFIPEGASFPLYMAVGLMGTIQAAASVFLMHQDTMETIRNFAIIYYSLFAYITFVLLLRISQHVDPIVWLMNTWLPSSARLLLLSASISIALGLYYWDYMARMGSRRPLPLFPDTFVPILSYKPTDASMPLLILLGLWVFGRLKRIEGPWVFALFLLAAARSRAALIVFLIALIAFWRPTRRGLGLVALIVVSFTLLAVTGVSIKVGGYREVSAGQFAKNISSLTGQSEEANESTAVNKAWRLVWWEAILKQAYNWNWLYMGSGWGRSPSEDLRLQGVEGINALRNPHNIFLSILARAGWVLTALWTLMHVSIIWELLKVRRRALEYPVYRSASTLLIAFLLASLVNGSTDVFLESPQNAIPHWCAVGVSWALITGYSTLEKRGIPYGIEINS